MTGYEIAKVEGEGAQSAVIGSESGGKDEVQSEGNSYHANIDEGNSSAAGVRKSKVPLSESESDDDADFSSGLMTLTATDAIHKREIQVRVKIEMGLKLVNNNNENSNQNCQGMANVGTTNGNSVASSTSNNSKKRKRLISELRTLTRDDYRVSKSHVGDAQQGVQVQLYASDFDNVTTAAKVKAETKAQSEDDLGQTSAPVRRRPKRLIKSVIRYEDVRRTHSQNKKLFELAGKCGSGFLCPAPSCDAHLSYDAKSCWKCGLNCCYSPGIGVVVLKDRNEISNVERMKEKMVDILDKHQDSLVNGKSHIVKKHNAPLETLTGTNEDIDKDAVMASTADEELVGIVSQNQTRTRKQRTETTGLTRTRACRSSPRSTTTMIQQSSHPSVTAASATTTTVISKSKAKEFLSNADPSECEACLGLFLPFYLQRHRKRSHNLAPDKYACPYCLQGTRYKSNSTCIQIFESKHERHEHIRQHHPNELINVSTEVKEKTKLYLYSCPCAQCDTYLTYNDLRDHMKTKHDLDASDYMSSITCLCPFCLAGKSGSTSTSSPSASFRSRRNVYHTTDELLAHIKEDHKDCTILGMKLKIGQSAVTSSVNSGIPCSRKSTRKRSLSSTVTTIATVKKSSTARGNGGAIKRAHRNRGATRVDYTEQSEDYYENDGEDDIDQYEQESKESNSFENDDVVKDNEFGDIRKTFVNQKYWQKLSIENLVYWRPVKHISWTYGQSVESLQKGIDDRMDRLRDNIKLESKRRRSSTSSSSKHDEEERDYVTENKLYLKGIRDRTNKAESEALEKFMYKDKCDEKQRWIDYQNRSRKKSPQELAMEELLMMPFQFDGRKRSKRNGFLSSESAAAARRSKCSIGTSCELCNGFYATCIVTQKEIEAAGGVVINACEQIRRKREEKTDIQIPSLSFRKILADEDLPDDRDEGSEEEINNSKRRGSQRSMTRRNDRSELLKLQEMKHTMEFIQDFNEGPLNLSSKYSKSRKDGVEQ